MTRWSYELPSLTALRVFETSARHLSFTRAGMELNVTPGAVSRQIKAIEDELGIPLFVRLGGGVALTCAGEDLYSAVATSFSNMSAAVRTIKRGGGSNTVTVACSDAFGTLWLLPRMVEFWAKYPDIVIDHLISDEARDYRRTEIDLRIRYGSGIWPDETAEFMFDDTLYPVCGPKFALDHAATSPNQLSELPLLHVDWVNPKWIDWPDVFRMFRIPYGTGEGRRFSRFSAAVAAACANMGVALASHRLVQSLIAEGKLVRFTSLEIPASGSYYLTLSNLKPASLASDTFAGWLRQQCPVAAASGGPSYPPV
ncbi:LysR substrate-binding domain-containing protein [Mesorhizobium sp. 128a]